MKYNAFISYSHAQDSDLAPHLETGLEKFAKPLFKRRALNIFRDANDLSASPDLWGKIEEGLKDSEYFIFLASPKAAQSKWCEKEVEFWNTNKSISKFLMVLTEGELIWDESKSDFDWSKTTAIPDNLSRAFKNEPLYVDFRNHNNDQLTLEHTDFRSKVILLAATIHGKSIGNMVGESAKQHSRNIRIRTAAISVLSLLLVLVGWFAFYALNQKEEAEKNLIEANIQKKEAIHQTNSALARKYLSDSKANYDSDPTLALRLAEHAYLFAKLHSLELNSYEDQLIKTYYNPVNFYLDNENIKIMNDSLIAKHEFNGYKLHFNNDSALVITNPNNQQITYKDPQWFGTPDVYSFSPSGKFIYCKYNMVAANALSTSRGLSVYDISLGLITSVWSRTISGQIVKNNVEFNANDSRFIINGGNETSIYDVNSNNPKSIVLRNNSTDIMDIDMTKSGNQIALANINGSIELFNLNSKQLKIESQRELHGHNLEVIKDLSFTEKDQYLISKSAKFTRKWDIKDRRNSKFVMLSRRTNTYDIMDGKDFGTLNKEGEFYFYYTSDGGDGLSFTYINKDGDSIANFIPDEYSKKWESSDKRFYATRNGLFNSKGERLIQYKEERYSYRHNLALIAFSINSKYFFLVDKLYFLDPEAILERIRNKKYSGSIYQLSETDKLNYQIKDLN